MTAKADEPTMEESLQQPRTKWWPILVLSMVILSEGTCYSFPGIALPQLTQAAPGELSLTTEEVSIFNSIFHVGMVIAVCLSWPLQTIVGQRIVILLGIGLNVSAWLTLILTTKVWLLYLARFAHGMCMILITPSVTTYLIETAHKNNRRRQTGMQYLSRSTGLMVPAITTAANLSWRQTGMVCCGMILVPTIPILFMPDSPRWLITRGCHANAQKALKFFRGDGGESETEYADIVAQANKEGEGGICHQASVLFRAPTRSTLALLLFSEIFICFGGINLIIPYMVPLLQTANITTNPYVISIVPFLTRTLGATVAVCLAHRLKRKPLIIVGFVNITLSFGMISLYFFLQKFVTLGISWMPIVAIVIILFSDGLAFTGYFPLQGELLPMSCRTIGVLSVKCANGISGAVNMMTYEQTVVALGMDGTFLLYGAFAAIPALIVTFCLQETHGVSLEEITKDNICTKKKDENTVKI